MKEQDEIMRRKKIRFTVDSLPLFWGKMEKSFARIPLEIGYFEPLACQNVIIMLLIKRLLCLMVSLGSHYLFVMKLFSESRRPQEAHQQAQ